MATANTVHGRIESARPELTTPRVALGLALVAILGFTLLFVQEPLVHDSLHNARHAAGIVCH
ncbi:CbtB domain-containing protein [Halorientalis halophila]|uniref:CbtB domain-containing protein n=1 Tax=Halorientalis halophila TaxID=3108499 RepID=UPI0030080701